MDRKKLLFVYNPYAGKGEIVYKINTIISTFTKNGYIITAYPTQGKNDAYNLVSKFGKEFDLVVCSGGDGTLNETVSGLMQLDGEKPILGYLPSGSTNDFAKTSNIPMKLDDAIENIITGVPIPMDVGLLNGNKYFNYVAAFGLFTDVSYDTPQDMKNIFGHSAYVLEGVKRLSNIEPIKCKVTCGEMVLEDEFLLGLITNSSSIAWLKIPTQSFYHGSGFQLILLRYSPKLMDYQGTVAALLGLAEPTSQFVICNAHGDLTIESDTPIAWTTDGEFGGKYTASKIDILENVISIIVPQPEE